MPARGDPIEGTNNLKRKESVERTTQKVLVPCYETEPDSHSPVQRRDKYIIFVHTTRCFDDVKMLCAD